MKHFIAIAALALAANTQASCESDMLARFEAYRALAIKTFPKVKKLEKASISIVALNSDWYGLTKHFAYPHILIANNNCSLFWAHADAVIAHELGHIVARDTISNDDESDADYFGAMLLSQEIRVALVQYMDEQCEVVGNNYFCGRVARWKVIFEKN